MPVAPTYPGVYIEEIPSGVRTIVGVSTSVTAFVGFFHRGPLDTPLRLFSVGDFDRELGGLHRDDESGYAIQQFFANGGTEAWVVRVAAPTPSAAALTLQDSTGTAVLRTFAGRRYRGESVEDPGVWGNNLRLDVDYFTREPDDETLFNLTVTEVAIQDGREVTLRTEAYVNVSTDQASPDYVLDTVNEASKLVQIEDLPDAGRPAQTGTSGGPVEVTADFSGEPVLTVDSGLGQLSPTLPALPAGTTFASDPAGVRRAVERALRAAGQQHADSRLAGATVSVTPKGDALRVVAGRGGADFDPHAILRFSGDTADKLGLSPAEGALENLQQYHLGGTDTAFQTDATAGADGELPDADAVRGSFDDKTGLFALRDVDLFNILCIPGAASLDDTDAAAVYSAAISFCEDQRAFLIVDIPRKVNDVQVVQDWVDERNIRHKNAAVYFPRVRIPDPLNGNRLRSVGASGTVAGIYARTDGERGVWKAPAGLEAVLRGVQGLDAQLTDLENGALNRVAINALRRFPVYGRVAWGARTLDGADVLASEWKYVPVRRLALFLEESLYRGLQWVVFEPNDEPLWSQIRLNVGAFMHNLFRQGAFQGTSPRDAYFVKCDAETTTQADINLGIVNIIVGFAPLKPAEFVIIKIQQLAGQVQT